LYNPSFWDVLLATFRHAQVSDRTVRMLLAGIGYALGLPITATEIVALVGVLFTAIIAGIAIEDHATKSAAITHISYSDDEADDGDEDDAA